MVGPERDRSESDPAPAVPAGGRRNRRRRFAPSARSRRARRGAARAALLGEQVPPGPAAQARRRPALLPARGRRAAAPDPLPAVRGRLHHQGRAEAAQGAAPPGARGRQRRRREAVQRSRLEPSPPIGRPWSCGLARAAAGARRPRRPRCASACTTCAPSWRRCARCCARSSNELGELSPAASRAIVAAVTAHRRRSVAQPGSASVWGTGGRRFESCRSDQLSS